MRIGCWRGNCCKPDKGGSYSEMKGRVRTRPTVPAIADWWVETASCPPTPDWRRISY